MCKQEFLLQLRKRLSGLPQDDIEERLHFYSEMIDDRMEDGLSEGDSVSQVGSIDDIIRQITSEIPLTKLVKEKIKPNRRLSPWEILLLALGFPIWFSLLVSAVAVVFSLYVSLWSVIISLWAVFLSVAACAFAGVVAALGFFIRGHVLTGIFAIGAAILCAGLSVLLFHGCKAASKGTVTLTKKMALWLKTVLSKRRMHHDSPD